jgi:glutathione S-transferase
MTRLHYFPGNASLIAHIVLEEIGAPFELSLVDRANAAHKSADYLKLNPNGLIPVLVDGSLVLYETAAICLHLADTHPKAGLAPALGTPERAHFYKWLMWMTNTLQATLIPYFYPDRWVKEGNAQGAAEVKASAETKIGAMLDQMDAHLAAHGKEWFLGERYGALDPYAFLMCRWTRGFGRPARSLPHLGPYLNRMLARPAVKRVLEKEKLPLPYV